MNNFLPEGSTWNFFGIPDRWRQLQERGLGGLKDVPYSPLISGQTLRPLLSGDAWKGMFEDIGLLGITDEEKQRRAKERNRIAQSQRRMPGTSAQDIAGYAAYEDQRKQEARDAELAKQAKDLSNMKLIDSIVKASQVKRPTSVYSTKAGTSVAPAARSLMTTPLAGRQQQRDLLNYIYG